MGARGAQWYRDTLSKGDRVLVIVRQGTVIHRREARVVTTMRHGAKVLLDNGREHTFRYADIEVPPKAGEPVPGVTDKPPAKVERIGRAVASVAADLVPAVPAQEERITHPDDIDAWIEMGRSMLSGIEAEIEGIGQEVHVLGDERDAIDREIETLLERKKGLTKRAAVLRKLGDG